MIFTECSLSQIPRILGFMDRDPSSNTYGCADRAYWHYRTSDFANARFQEASLVLALAYVLPGAQEGRYFQRPLIKDWAMAAIDFWAKKLHKDGSTDESYPNERHFCSTALSLYAVTEAALVLKEKLPRDMGSTGNFLARYDNLEVANQMAGASMALYNLYLCTGQNQWKDASEDKLKKLLSLQAPDGAFGEYGGFDLGYDTVTLSFLAGLYKRTGREDIKSAAQRSIGKIRPCLDEDGYFTSEGMSRRTQFLYPYGFSVFAPEVLENLAHGLKKNVVLNPSWMDDRYCIPLTGNYLLTALER